MSGHTVVPRKQRTREHVIADLAVHYFEGFVLRQGHTAHRVLQDYGYDLLLFTYDEVGCVETGLINVQVKATDVPKMVASVYVFDLDIKDYNLWIDEPMPVILVLYDASRNKAVWHHIQGYFASPDVRRPRRTAMSVRVYFPPTQRVSLSAVAAIRRRKLTLLRPGSGGP